MTGYSKDFQAAHEARMKAEEDARKEQQRQNAAARNAYLDDLEAERQAKRDEAEARLDAQLAPTKERARNQWLYDHPDKTADDFEAHAWPLLRKNLVEDQRESIKNKYLDQARAAGRYGS